MQGFQGHRSWTYRGVMAGRTQSTTRNWYGLKSSHKHGPLHGVCFTQASARAEPQNFAQYGFVTEIGWGGISRGSLWVFWEDASSVIATLHALVMAFTVYGYYLSLCLIWTERWVQPAWDFSFSPEGHVCLFPAFRALKDGASHSQLWLKLQLKPNVTL